MTSSDQSYQFFIDEVPFLLESIENGILSLKEEKTTAKVHEIMRAVHSLKGGAATVALEGIKNISHQLEDYIKVLFKETVIVDAELETYLLQGFDCLRNALREQIETGNYQQKWEDESELVWQKLAEKLGDISTEDYLPSSADLGVDMVESMFEVDIGEAIENLTNLKDSLDPQALLKEVSLQAEVLSGFGEMLNLPRLKKIAETTLMALEANPHEVKTITQLMLDDVIKAREKVLSGDGQIEENPSKSLLKLAGKEGEILNQTDPDNSLQDLELQKQAYQFFIEEAVELLELIDRGLESIFIERTNEQIYEISRAAHSLKGGARSAGLEDLGNIALRVEKTFKALHNQEIIIDRELESYVRELYQTLRNSVNARIENREWDEKAELAQANLIWEQMEAKLGDSLTQAAEYLPSSSDLGIDLATSIFEVDVVAGIEHLREVIANGQNDRLAAELTTQIDVFSGFGEMLALPGFTQICQTAREALAKNPEQVLSLASCFLDNIIVAKDQVLGGDRQRGGEVSPQLLALASSETMEMEETDLSSADEVQPRSGTYTETPIDTSDRAYSFFVEEAPELLQTIESGLLTIKQERSTAKIHELMRAAHSLKGGAASVGLEAIKIIAHKLEDIFKCLYNQEVEIDTNLESWLLEGYDCLANPLTEQINTGSYDAQQAIDKAEGVWAKIETVLGDTLKRVDDYLPSSSDLGVDIVASMFEVDVRDQLQRLREVASSPDNYPLAAELKATLEVFAGFGEMLNLPGFAEIAQKGLMAVEKKPDRVLEIINLIINDIETARDLVLKGDRHRGGEPSEALLSFAEEESSEIENHPFLEDVFGDGTETDSPEVFKEEENPEFPSLEEIFGEEAEISELISGENTEEEDTLATSLEKVLGIDLDSEQLVQINEALERESQEELENPSLEAIFTAQLNQNEIDILEQANQEDWEQQQENQSPSIEEVFGTADLTALEMEQTNQTETESDNEFPRLEDLFANQDVVPEISEISNDETEENKATEPSLEDVFGDFSSLEKQSTSSTNQLPEITIANPESSTPSGNDPQTNQQNLNEAVESINKIFVDLPPLQQESEIKSGGKKQPSPVLHQPPVQKKSKSSSQPKSNLTIRVDLERLERMNNIIGELSINRNGLSLQNDKLQNAVKELLDRFANFSQMAGNLREISDKMLIAPEKFGKKLTPSGGITSYGDHQEVSDTDSSFDSLEMDSYGSMYNVVQSLMEQIIQLEEAVDDIALFAKLSGRTVEDQRQMLNNIRDELMWSRMLPLGEVLNRFPRVLRDLSVKYHKPVNLKLSGTEVLVDKAALEKLYDPLVHLLRNAFDHGIESQQVRKKQGKPEEGTIEIKAYHQGNQTVIEIKDDGGGLNVEKIGRKAVKIGLLSPEQLAVTSKKNLLDLIFEPGFSTAAKVTDISGRGVGLDIVRSQLRSLKGTISVNSSEGKGTSFILKLPLTLTIDKLLVLSAGSNFFALPSDNIEEILVPESHQIKTSGEKRFLYYQQEIIPIYALSELINYNCHIPSYITRKPLAILPVPEDWHNPLLLLRQSQQLFAIEVERLISEQELVIKPFGKAITAPRYTYGCTILGDGNLIPVINGNILLEHFFSLTQSSVDLSSTSFPAVSSRSSQGQSSPASDFQVSSILVVDDSAAMRRTLALSLEKAGYRVLQAKDGKEALDQLTQNSQISLVICDIEMPNMNGFEFLGQRRRDPELMNIPVAMLTSRSNDKHRKLATHLGANAYFTKPYIEQKFLAAIKNIINQ